MPPSPAARASPPRPDAVGCVSLHPTADYLATVAGQRHFDQPYEGDADEDYDPEDRQGGAGKVQGAPTPRVPSRLALHGLDWATGASGK